MATSVSHIPKKRLIDLVELDKAGRSENSFVEDVKERLHSKRNNPSPQTSPGIRSPTKIVLSRISRAHSHEVLNTSPRDNKPVPASPVGRTTSLSRTLSFSSEGIRSRVVKRSNSSYSPRPRQSSDDNNNDRSSSSSTCKYDGVDMPPLNIELLDASRSCSPSPRNKVTGEDNPDRLSSPVAPPTVRQNSAPNVSPSYQRDQGDAMTHRDESPGTSDRNMCSPPFTTLDDAVDESYSGTEYNNCYAELEL